MPYAQIINDEIVGVFNMPQPSIEGVELVDDDDARLAAFYESQQQASAPIDPVDKLKAFLAANPDVADILK